MAASVGKGTAVETNGTLQELTQMQERTAGQELPAGPADRDLTEQKQRRIVEGASKVLFEQGFHGVSIRDIASACGMSMGQLYHYISSKDDILYLMHRYHPGAVAPEPGRRRLRADVRPG